MSTVLAALRRNWLLYVLLIVAVLAAWGWVKPLIEGPDLRFSTITRTRPVPVKVETVKWLTKVERQITRQRVEVPVEVIREVPAKVEQRLVNDFQIKLPELQSEGRELVDIVGVPKAPHGGEMALTIHTATGKIDSIFRPKAAPFVEAGGMREAGVDYDPLGVAVRGYYRQDLIRIGPGIVNAKVFAAAPLRGSARAPEYGASIGVAIRF